MAKARESVALELKDKEQELTQAKTKLQEAQQAELNLRKRAHELDDEKRAFDLTLARKLDEEREKIRGAAKKEAAEERALKEAEKDKLIGDLTRQIDELKRKSEQGSQQMQGEVMELELEDILRRQFPYDEIVPVPKGVHGGDVLQHVRDAAGCPCGVILWESKRTKAWSDGWLPKLRDDQRAAKAQIAALATVEMPKGLATLGCLDGVWVTSRTCLLGLASALRNGLIEVAAAKRAIQGQQGKMEILYNYLSGPEFRHRVEGIVEAFVALRTDLEKEKAAIQRIWAKREKQIERAVANTVGLHGDFSGIIGSSLPQIENWNCPRSPPTRKTIPRNSARPNLPPEFAHLAEPILYADPRSAGVGVTIAAILAPIFDLESCAHSSHHSPRAREARPHSPSASRQRTGRGGGDYPRLPGRRRANLRGGESHPRGDVPEVRRRSACSLIGS